MRRATLALVVFSAACGRDFDSLFFDAGTADIDAGSGNVTDASGTGDANVDIDAGTDATTCPASCINQSGCDAGSQTCSTVCSGCCDCGMQTCPNSDNNKRCEAECTAGATCNVTCLLNGPCSMTCAAGSHCLLSCSTSATSCDLSCADGSKKDCGGGRFVCGRSCP